MTEPTDWIVIEYDRVDIRMLGDTQPRWGKGGVADAHVVSARGEQEAIGKVGARLGEGIFSAISVQYDLPTCSVLLSVHPDE